MSESSRGFSSSVLGVNNYWRLSILDSTCPLELDLTRDFQSCDLDHVTYNLTCDSAFLTRVQLGIIVIIHYAM